MSFVEFIPFKSLVCSSSLSKEAASSHPFSACDAKEQTDEALILEPLDLPFFSSENSSKSRKTERNVGAIALSDPRISKRPRNLPSKFKDFHLERKAFKKVAPLPPNSSTMNKRISPDSEIVSKQKRQKPVDVFLKQFGVQTPVAYSGSITVDPKCEEALKKAWTSHIRKHGTSYDTAEARRFIDCIESMTDDASDSYAEKYEVKTSNNPLAGNGLFAKADGEGYKKNQVIGVYTGLLTFAVDVEDKEYAFEWPETAFAAFTIDGKAEGNALRFMNHAPPEKANVSSVEFFYKGKPYIVFIAEKAIEPGTELCYDYGPEYWIKKGIEPQTLL